MTELDARVAQFDRAVLLLPHDIRSAYRELPLEERAGCEEIRLRNGTEPTALLPEGEKTMNFRPLSQRDVEATLTVATNASFHTVKDSLRHGFVTVAGGFRIGLGGNAILREGEIQGFRAVSSLCIRIPRQIPLPDTSLYSKLFPQGRLCSVLMISPPGGGKTTLLRELIRMQSNAGRRVSLVDERSEIAAMVDGKTQLDVGKRTDILEGCGKADGALIMLKSMNPEIIAMDEITDPSDMQAITTISRCGVSVFATVHGDMGEENAQMVGLLHRANLFDKAVYIRKNGAVRTYVVEEWGAEKC